MLGFQFYSAPEHEKYLTQGVQKQAAANTIWKKLPVQSHVFSHERGFLNLGDFSSI